MPDQSTLKLVKQAKRDVQAILPTRFIRNKCCPQLFHAASKCWRGLEFQRTGLTIPFLCWLHKMLLGIRPSIYQMDFEMTRWLIEFRATHRTSFDHCSTIDEMVYSQAPPAEPKTEYDKRRADRELVMLEDEAADPVRTEEAYEVDDGNGLGDFQSIVNATRFGRVSKFYDEDADNDRDYDDPEIEPIWRRPGDEEYRLLLATAKLLREWSEKGLLKNQRRIVYAPKFLLEHQAYKRGEVEYQHVPCPGKLVWVNI